MTLGTATGLWNEGSGFREESLPLAVTLHTYVLPEKPMYCHTSGSYFYLFIFTFCYFISSD